MLRELIDMWRSDGQKELCSAIDEFAEMIGDVEFVFNKSWEIFTGEKSVEENKDQVVERDIAVNKHERSIRRHLVEHLAINPRHDAPGCLAMMSIVKDAERMGDYAKNIMDLAEQVGGKQTDYKYYGKLQSIQIKVAGNLPKLKKAYVESSGSLATEILGTYAPIKEECKELLETLLDENIAAREAVVTALVAKYLGRISSHLGNIASGIIYPLDKIDFVRPDPEE